MWFTPQLSENAGSARQRMVRACAARLKKAPLNSLVWVEFGDGSVESVEAMASHLDIATFRKIYLVNTCASSNSASLVSKIDRKWSNVEILNTYPTTFKPFQSKATLITFTHSLSRIRDFMPVIDSAISYLAPDGLVGVADFFTSAKHDLPNRQHSYLWRWFWRAAFELKGFDVGPERRQYLEHRLTAAFEYNGSASIAPVPFLNAPYYVWIGHLPSHNKKESWRFPARASDEFEAQRPPQFPPTFLYSLSWEDPRVDEGVLKINPADTVLTLTSGGCNALDLLNQGAGKVISVDINPAQSHLLELKRAAVMRLPFEDVWSMFGEGIHPQFEKLLETELAPFLSQGASNFWYSKAYYFKNGLYYHGGMGRLIRATRFLAKLMRQEQWIESLVNAATLEKQKELWFATVGKCLSQGSIITRVLALLVTNRLVLWFCAGVCKGQLKLIQKEDNIYSYIVRCLNSTAEHSHLRDSNYFYRCCLTGKFARWCCPRFLEENCFHKLKEELASEERLLIRTGSFVEELSKRKYSKVILMDHVDWLDQPDIDTLCAALRDHVTAGGRVIWRSASRSPDYAKCIERAGFQVMRLGTSEKYMDRVNMYASFYVGVRKEGTVSILKSPLPQGGDPMEENKAQPHSPVSVLARLE